MPALRALGLRPVNVKGGYLATYKAMCKAICEAMHKTIYAAIILIAACAYPISAAACFDDEKWAELQTNPAPGLLYVWSPRMVLSAHNAATAQTAAAARGLTFWAVHDGRVPEAEINQALAQLAAHPDVATRASAQALRHSQPLCSPALAVREALRHFPTAWVTPSAAASIAPDVSSSVASLLPTATATATAIVGAMPAFAWAISLAQRLPHGSAPAPASVFANAPAAAAPQPVESGQTAPLPSQSNTPPNRTAERPAKADTPPSQASAKPQIAPSP